MDSEREEYHQLLEDNKYSWDVYHIENYLLEEEFIYRVVEDLCGRIPADINSLEKTRAALKKAAKGVSGQLVNHKVQVHVTQLLSNLTSVRINPSSKSPGEEVTALIAQKKTKLENAVNAELSRETLLKFENSLKEQVESSFSSDDWKRKVPGREILKKFVNEHVHVSGKGVSYEAFRNLIRSKMAAANYKPKGMTEILEEIEPSIQSEQKKA